ncbi:hypothetical protein Acr_25g0006100 [Actinidia rufa]|uniref:Uncharacterized protein n=1 Tax=Actinidia rufa TaxID=165716 RepID=A0A7J0GZJ7_9ERIC|nr:hypothetical protein Acr_25g0006100 [Actinidia rufa]
MDTRGKTNTEFRNEVSEVLTCHESSFDQIHATLQTILTDLYKPSRPKPTFPLLATATPLRSMMPPNPPNPTLNLTTLIPPLNSISLKSPTKIPLDGFTELNNTLNSKVLSLLNESSLLRSTSKELPSNGIPGSPNSKVPSIGPSFPRHYSVVLDPLNTRTRLKLLPESSTPPTGAQRRGAFGCETKEPTHPIRSHRRCSTRRGTQQPPKEAYPYCRSPRTTAPSQKYSRHRLFCNKLCSALRHGDHSKLSENLPLCLCATPPRQNPAVSKSSASLTVLIANGAGLESTKQFSYLSSRSRFPFADGAFSTQEAYINIGSSSNVKRDGTTTIDPILQALRLTSQRAKVAEALLGISASDGYTISSSQAQFPFVGKVTSTQDKYTNIGSSPNVKRDGTTPIDPILQAHQSTDQWVKVAKALLGISASDGYTSSSFRILFPFISKATSPQDAYINIGNIPCEAPSTQDVCIDIESSPNMEKNVTITIELILQARQSTDRWVKLVEIVLTISASAVYNSSSNFPKATNSTVLIASLTVISLRHTGQVASTKILAKFRAIACASGTLAGIRTNLPEEYTWIASVAFLIPATAMAFA